MKVRFLADVNFNQKIVAGLLLREPSIDFALPQAMIPERMKDQDVLDLAQSGGVQRFLWLSALLNVFNNLENLLFARS